MKLAILQNQWLLENIYCLPGEIKVTSDLLISSLTTIASAFTGAWAAFALQNCRIKKEIHNQHIAAANKALCTIYHFWSILFQFQKDIVNPYRGKAGAWLNMPATPPFSSKYGLSSFKADELTFLLQTKHANTFSNLILEEHRFHMAIQLIEERSSVILNQVFPKLGTNMVIGEQSSEQEIENIIGVDKVHRLKILTSGIIKNVDEDIASLKLAHDEFRNSMNDIYPKDKFNEINFKTTSNEDSSENVQVSPVK